MNEITSFEELAVQNRAEINRIKKELQGIHADIAKINARLYWIINLTEYKGKIKEVSEMVKLLKENALFAEDTLDANFIEQNNDDNNKETK